MTLSTSLILEDYKKRVTFEPSMGWLKTTLCVAQWPSVRAQNRSLVLIARGDSQIFFRFSRLLPIPLVGESCTNYNEAVCMTWAETFSKNVGGTKSKSGNEMKNYQVDQEQLCVNSSLKWGSHGRAESIAKLCSPLTHDVNGWEQF